MGNIKKAIRALNADIKRLNLREADFFRQLNKDAAIIKENAKVEANIVYSFNNYKFTIVL
jgi:hypothetical protein